jgi:hypothetical protein
MVTNWLAHGFSWAFEPDGYCAICGTALFDDETVFCNDCLQDKWYDENQDFYDSWFNQEELDK